MAENDFISQLLLMQQIQAMEDANRRRQQQAAGQQQGGGGMSPMQGYNAYSKYSQYSTPSASSSATATPSASAAGEASPSALSSAFSTTGSEGWGYGAGGALTAAMLGAGTLANIGNNRSFDGVQSGTIFQGQGFNDPFASLTARRLGFEGATPGEQLDADLKNEDAGGLGKSIPDYLMHIGTPWNYFENEAIDEMGFLPNWSRTGLKWLANPVSQLVRSIF